MTARIPKQLAIPKRLNHTERPGGWRKRAMNAERELCKAELDLNAALARCARLEAALRKAGAL